MDITIPEDLVKKLEQKIEQTDFKSVQDYVMYILNQLVSKNDEALKEETTYSEEDEEALKKKLGELGYL